MTTGQLEDSGSLGDAGIEELYRILSRCMPGRVAGAKGPKGHPNPFRVCVTCMLSAQSRDANTAAASKALFKPARTPRTILKLTDWKIATAIQPCGLYNVKAMNVRKFCEALLSDQDQIFDRRPSHEDAVALWEEIDLVLEGLPDRTAEIISMRLEGRNRSEIAKDLDLSRQSIHRILKLVQDRLTQRFEQIPWR